MNIEDFRDIHVITEGFKPVDSKDKEFDYCIPLCKSEGYFIELGVWFARSLNHMAKNNPQYSFFGFDTFEGINEIWDTGGKIVDMSRFQISEIDMDGDSGLPKVEKNVTLVRGLFQDTLPEWLQQNEGPISFINMDPDVYSATIYALETLNDRIIPGTIIRFDELCCWRTVGFPGFDKEKNHTLSLYTTWEEGEWKALNEWLLKYDRVVEPLWRNWHQAAGVKVIK